MKRNLVCDSVIESAFKDAKAHMQNQLTLKGNKEFASLHEISGVIAEEFDEFKETVHKNNTFFAENELLDIATAALFGYATLLNLRWNK